MTERPEKVLIIGYGNPGRLDDGLGPALAEAFVQKALPGVTVDANYLLTVEDASDISEHDVVVFADASVEDVEPFFFREVDPKVVLSFSTHHMEPPSVLGLAHDMFGAKTKGYALGIRGYEFDEFGQRLSEGAQRNLSDAIHFLENRLERRDFTPLAPAVSSGT